jgi:hypothetical protein
MNYAKLEKRGNADASGLRAAAEDTPAIVLATFWASTDLDCLFARSPDDPMTER